MDERLAEQIAALRQEVTALKLENRRLWARLDHNGEEDPKDAELVRSRKGEVEGPIGRRWLLGRLGGAAAAGAGLALLGARPAGADHLGAVDLGHPAQEAGSLSTGVLSSASTNALHATNNGSGTGIEGGAVNGAGVVGEGFGTGGTGVRGLASATSGTTKGVLGQVESPFGTAVYGTATATSGSTFGVLGHVASPFGTAVYATATATSGSTYGVYSEVLSPSGIALRGISRDTSGTTYGVHGHSASTKGRAVYGEAVATSGKNYGVLGVSNSPAGYGVYSKGRFKCTGRAFLATPNSAPADADLKKGMISFYLDQVANELKVTVRYPTGEYKTGAVALA